MRQQPRVPICAVVVVLAWSASVRAQVETRLYINIGGPEVTDSRGRTWLGDQGATADPLDIRVDDAGGANTIENWCVPDPASLQALGFDPSNANDAVPLSSIRWDLGSDGIDYAFAIPVPEGMYDLDLYFCESCCPQRHFKVDVQGATVFENVSSSLYAGAIQTAGRLSVTDVAVGADGILSISLLPCPECDCPECVGGVVIDNNPVLSAIGIETAGLDPCRDPLFGRCPSGLTCTIDEGGAVTGTWTAPECAPPSAYQIRKNGIVLAELPGDAVEFTDALTERAAIYEVVAQLEGDEISCLSLSCTVVNPAGSFEAPFYVNLGGPGVVDSIGRAWLADQGAGADTLGIRPDDAGGTNTIEAWCVPSPLSLQASGFDPSSPADAVPTSSIRWDPGADAIPYVLELPVAPGDYDVEFYICEQCCLNRHFSIDVQGATAFPDVSAGLYAGGALQAAGRLRTDGVTVADGEPLNITVLPCFEPDCPGGVDANSILSALCVLPAASEPCDNPLLGRCPTNLQCTFEGGTVTATFVPPECAQPEGYEVFRNGQLLTTLPGDAAGFTDTLDVRTAVYELVTPGCLPLSCTASNPDAPFEEPLYVNFGGPTVTDSLGRTWLGDEGVATDNLGIRPDDNGGANFIGAWCVPSADSLAALGFDPANSNDAVPLSSIRWDDGADAIDYTLEIPLAEEGLYDVEFYFCESCCDFRHFSVDAQGSTVFSDVSSAAYAGGLPNVAGRLVAEDVPVFSDGILNITLLPCLDPACPGGTDGNAILSGLCVVRTGELDGGDDQLASDCNQDGARTITDVICHVMVVFPGFVLVGSPANPCDGGSNSAGNLQLLDLNGDGSNDVSDIVSHCNFLFMGGAPPAQGEACFAVNPVFGCQQDPGCE